MGYLDELANPIYIASIEKWRPEARRFPIRSDFFGRITPTTHAPTSEWGVWRVHHFSERLPSAGFKIHISPRVEDFDLVLERAMDIAAEEGVTIKHVARREYLWALYSKNAPRLNAGKAIVLYPDNHHLDTCLQALSSATRGLVGAPVAGDYRLGNSILHVRYGAFETHSDTAYDQTGNPIIIGPDGASRPDLRGAVAEPADAAHLPSIFREDPTPNDRLPDRYRIESAYTVHAGGGVYRGVDMVTKRAIVLKRGIRHMGIDGAGNDAAQRISQEAETLASLSQKRDFIGRIPEPLDAFWVGGSYFLVTSLMPGVTLYEWTASNSPIYAFSCRESPAYRHATVDYAEKVESISKQLREIVRRLSESGIVHNDLQPSNVLIDDGGNVGLIDFEAATDGRPSGMRGVSWVYGPNRAYGIDAEDAAVAMLEAYAYWPPIVAAHLDPDWPPRFDNHLRRYFPQKRHQHTSDVAGRATRNSYEEPSVSAIENAYARAVSQYFETGLGLPNLTLTRNGQAENRTIASFGKGLLATLALRTCSTHTADARRRLVNRLAGGPSMPLRTHDLGLIDGVGLAAPLLASSGHDSEAGAWGRSYVEALLNVDFDRTDWGMATGLAGYLSSLQRLREIGLQWAEIDELLERISGQLKQRVASVLRQEGSVASTEPALGLMAGASGVAVALHRYEMATDTPSSLPRELIDWELSKYQKVHGALFFVDSSRRFRPYLDRGNAGLIVAALAVLDRAEMDEPRWLAVIEGLRTGVGVAPGLMTGAAGLLYAATSLDDAGTVSTDTSALVRNLRSDLNAMLVRTPNGPISPGNLGRRISLDGSHGAGGATAALVGTLDTIFSLNHALPAFHQAKEDAHV